MAVNSYIGVGDRLPDLRLPDMNGNELRLESLRGKKLLLFFWGSW